MISSLSFYPTNTAVIGLSLFSWSKINALLCLRLFTFVLSTDFMHYKKLYELIWKKKKKSSKDFEFTDKLWTEE